MRDRLGPEHHRHAVGERRGRHECDHRIVIGHRCDARQAILARDPVRHAVELLLLDDRHVQRLHRVREDRAQLVGIGDFDAQYRPHTEAVHDPLPVVLEAEVLPVHRRVRSAHRIHDPEQRAPIWRHLDALIERDARGFCDLRNDVRIEVRHQAHPHRFGRRLEPREQVRRIRRNVRERVAAVPVAAWRGRRRRVRARGDC